jgi:ferric-dicitrate binding protein FerR (iron transport regulator)
MNDALRRRIDSFVDAVCEERADAEAFACMEESMRGNPEAQRYYLQQMDMLDLMSWELQSSMAHEAMLASRPPVRRPLLRLLGLAAAATLLLSGFLLLKDVADDLPTRELITEAPVPLERSVRLKCGTQVTAEGAADWTTDGEQFLLLDGLVAAKIPVDAKRFVLEAGSVQLSGAGSTFGISMQDGAIKVAVLKGEVLATIDSDYIGRKTRLRLNRDDGFEVDAIGALTTDLIGDSSRFTSLLQVTHTRVVNAGFELPVAETPQTAPAGWILTSHPIANADGMEVDAGVMRDVKLRSESSDKRQWAYLNAEVFADGKSAYASMHQAVGSLESGAHYRLAATIARPQGPLGNAGGYSISLVAGSAMHGPAKPLQVWRNPVVVRAGESERVELEMRAPSHDQQRADVLFVVIAAIPGGQAGLRQVLVDDVSLEIEEK